MAEVESMFSSKIKCDVENSFDYFDSTDPLGSMQRLGQSYVKRKEDELNQKRVVSDGFEQKYTLDYYRIGKREAKKRRQIERSGSAGDDWFGIKAPELTDEVKRDLEVIQMRRALFRDHQYKRKATDKAPEHFQMGKIVEGSGDFYSSRLTRKERANTIVDELLKDAAFQRSAKQRYERIAIANVDKKKAKAMRKKQTKRQQLVRKKLTAQDKEWKNRSEEHRLTKKKDEKRKSLKSAKKHQKRLKKNK